ncbi:nucleotide exchange factor GrpE [Haematomicrobium sanguinis]|uniref:nucleotide exchange factor GrpE n=1 Tax=Haematomicrobium sanguinis TaxID=479106 RepID=UPI00047AF5ED|nr:nucleotide exchange factor GrpE [Haematomicrobium sanguinis]
MSQDHGYNQDRDAQGSENPEEPVSFVDKRRVDPETGQVRSQGSGPESAEPFEDLGEEEIVDAEVVDDASDAQNTQDPLAQDPLAQAEQVLKDAEAAGVGAAGANGAAGAGAGGESAELRNDLLRLQAEYVNYRKRVERDRAVAGEMAVVGVLNSLLPVLDDIDAGRAAGDLEGGPFAAIATKLESTLEKYGLQRINETGVEFDPNIHEALMQQPSSEVAVDTVQQILRSGYRNKDRVLRAAQVIVAVPE